MDKDFISKEQKKLLKEIMEANFVLVETNLYLDSHPTDEGALRLHNTYSQRYKELLSLYEAKYGLLRYTGMSGCPWSYINEPWPWEINFDVI
ncbi:MAG: spore coat protein CotJB [Tissierellia bacterium]|nr:spore coat protein CotJB [Tissierellia bacterium]